MPLPDTSTVLSLIDRLRGADPAARLCLSDSDDAPVALTYARLHAHILVSQRRFLDAGVVPGTRVVFPFETDAETICAFLALVRLGAVPLSVKTVQASGGGEIFAEFAQRLAVKFGASLILCTPLVERLDLPGLEKLAVPMLEEGPVATAPPAAAVDAAQLAFVQFSSGSTGFPKGVPITHGNLMSHLDAITAFDRRSGDTVGASWLPLYHDMGLIGGLLTCLYARHSVILRSPAQFIREPLAWLDLLTEHRVQIFPTPNFGLQHLLRKITPDAAASERWDLRALRHVYLGSDPVDAGTLARFTSMLAPAGLGGHVIQPCYGMAESVLMVSGNYGVAPRVVTAPGGVASVSCGAAMPGQTIRIVDDHGHAVPDGTIGNIEIRGGNLAGAYLDPAQPFYNAAGYYPTGDLGFLADGELYVSGRNGDRLKINGQSFFSNDLEQKIAQCDFVRDGRAVVLEVDGELTVLAELSAARHRGAIDACRAEVSALVMKHFSIKIKKSNVVFIKPGQLLRTSSGKLRRREMSEKLRQGEFLAVPPPTA